MKEGVLKIIKRDSKMLHLCRRYKIFFIMYQDKKKEELCMNSKNFETKYIK